MDQIHPLEEARRRCAREKTLIDMVNSSFETLAIHTPAAAYQRAWEQTRTRTTSGRADDTAARTAIAHAVATGEVPSAVTAPSGERESLHPDDILLTSGSSISYHLLLAYAKTRGGAARTTVALPLPGYPLFEGLLDVLDLEPVWYHCNPERGFLPDTQEIRALLTPAAEWHPHSHSNTPSTPPRHPPAERHSSAPGPKLAGAALSPRAQPSPRAALDTRSRPHAPGTQPSPGAKLVGTKAQLTPRAALAVPGAALSPGAALGPRA